MLGLLSAGPRRGRVLTLRPNLRNRCTRRSCARDCSRGPSTTRTPADRLTRTHPRPSAIESGRARHPSRSLRPQRSAVPVRTGPVRAPLVVTFHGFDFSSAPARHGFSMYERALRGGRRHYLQLRACSRQAERGARDARRTSYTQLRMPVDVGFRAFVSGTGRRSSHCESSPSGASSRRRGTRSLFAHSPPPVETPPIHATTSSATERWRKARSSTYRATAERRRATPRTLRTSSSSANCSTRRISSSSRASRQRTATTREHRVVAQKRRPSGSPWSARITAEFRRSWPRAAACSCRRVIRRACPRDSSDRR